MVDSPSRKRALEILADPLCHEAQWLGALAILGGKVPAKNRRLGKKFVRFLKRTAGLTLAYTALFYCWGLFQQLLGWSAVSSPLYILPFAFVWATLEATAGVFTLLALYVMLTNLGSILSLNAAFQTTWMVILINVLCYAKWNWRPYVMVPLHKVASFANNRKLLH